MVVVIRNSQGRPGGDGVWKSCHKTRCPASDFGNIARTISNADCVRNESVRFDHRDVNVSSGRVAAIGHRAFYLAINDKRIPILVGVSLTDVNVF
jgi:hypothetical protein